MTEAGSIVYKILADASQFKNVLSDVGRDTASLNNGFDKSGESIGKKLLSGIKKVVTAGAIVKIFSSAINAGADMEQAIGGIETLFGAKGAKSAEEYAQIVGKSVDDVRGEFDKLKESENKMLENANNAWRTAGVSANKYMEVVTGFSASLLQGLDGDTGKASEIADRIMKDMSDNSNKFGTDISSIQNAYQGFAKQNYTMLDNLKLGYGGTKTEMERLIKDASQMKDIQKELGITVDESSMSFDNVANAISVMQQKLYITGTTEKEATQTLTGSLNAMKASWENLLASMALGEDVSESFENLVNSAVTYAENLLKMIWNIAENIPSVLFGLAERLVKQGLPLATEWIRGLAEGIATKIPELVQTVSELITELVTTFLNNASEFTSAGLELLSSLAQGIIDSLPFIIDAVGKILAGFIDYIISNLPNILQTGIQIVFSLVNGLISSIPNVVSAVANLIGSIFNSFRSQNWLSIGSNIISGIVNGLLSGVSSVISAATSVARRAWESAKNFLGISSPSKKFSFLGKMADEGLALGIGENTKMVEDAMNEVSDMMLSTDLSLGKPNLNGTTSYSGESSTTNYGGIVINMNVPEGMNATQFVNQIEHEIAKRTIRRGVVFG